MEYCNGRLCISTRELFDGGIVTEANYRNWTNRNRVDEIRRGGGSKGNYALVAVDSLPQKYAKQIHAKGLVQSPFATWFASEFKINQQAIEFYGDHKLSGVNLSYEKALSLTMNASILDLLEKLTSSMVLINRLFGGKIKWITVCNFLISNKRRYNHTLPISEIRIKRKLEQYQKFGFKSLISQRFGNQNAKKK